MANCFFLGDASAVPLWLAKTTGAIQAGLSVYFDDYPSDLVIRMLQFSHCTLWSFNIAIENPHFLER